MFLAGVLAKNGVPCRTITIRDPTRPQTRWQHKVIGVIWDIWHELWITRNGDLHGHDAATKALALKTLVDSALTDIYDMRVHMEPSVQELLFSELHEHLAQPMRVNQNWLTIHTPLVCDSIRKVKEKTIQGMRSIRHSYFRPQS